MKHPRLIGFVLFALALLIACGPASETLPDSELQHNEDEPVRDPEAWNWRSLDTDAERSYALIPFLQMNRWNSLGIVEREQEVSVGLNATLDSFDQALRKSQAGKLDAIPKPQLLIYAEKKPNATMMPVPVCFRGPRVQVSEKLAPPSKEMVYLSWEGRLETVPGNFPCKDVEVPATDWPQFVDWINAQLVQCKTILDSDLLLFNDQCQRPKKLPSENPSKLMLYVSSNLLVVSSGMIARFSADEFLAMVAHELAHYYRSHNTSAQEAGLFNFFYQIPQEHKNHDQRPVAEPQLAALGNQVRGLKLPHLYYRRVAAQTLISELFRPAVQLVKTIDAFQECSGDFANCNKACRETRIALDHPETMKKLGIFPFEKLDASTEETYRTIEQKINACLEPVQIVEADPSGTARGVAIEAKRVRDALAADIPLYQLIQADLKLLPALKDTLVATSDLIKTKIDAHMEPLRRASEQRLGFYTAEQEADELGLEWLFDVGIDSAAALRAEFVLASIKEEELVRRGLSDVPLAVGRSRCEELSRAGWQDPDGVFPFVPIADFSDLHHSSCFRAYNLDREIKGHGYVVSADPAFDLEPISQSWAAYQKRALEFSDGTWMRGLRMFQLPRTPARPVNQPAAPNFHNCPFNIN